MYFLCCCASTSYFKPTTRPTSLVSRSAYMIGALMALIELKGIVEDWDKFPAAGAASVRLSATPSTEWSRFFCQALALAAAEGGIPPDFGETASVTGDRIVIPGASREAVIRYLGALSHIVEETNRITAGYHGLLRRNHEAQ